MIEVMREEMNASYVSDASGVLLGTAHRATREVSAVRARRRNQASRRAKTKKGVRSVQPSADTRCEIHPPC